MEFKNLKLNRKKRLSLVFIFVFFSLAISAQNESFPVNFKGTKPNITDLALAYISYKCNDEEEGIYNESLNSFKYAFERYRKGLAQKDGVKFTVDQKNGYISYEWKYEDSMQKIDMCYWNETDQKHKLFCCNVASFINKKYHPGQFDCIEFCRYTNATKKMTCNIEVGQENAFDREKGAWVYFTLPRVGKNLKVTWTWYDNPNRIKYGNMKWNGHKFHF